MRLSLWSTLFPYTTLFRSERIVSEAGAELAAAFGSALRTVVVYGSAEHPDFRPERSDVNFAAVAEPITFAHLQDRKSTRLNSSHVEISYAVFCLKKNRFTN